MSTKKKLVAIAVTITALTAGSVGVASAHDKGAGRGNVMAELVSAGTITQAQANAITGKFAEKHAHLFTEECDAIGQENKLE